MEIPSDAKLYIGILSAVLGGIAFIPYIRDTLKGTTTPHIYTWITGGTVLMTAFALQSTSGAGAGAWMTLVSSLLTYSIAVLAYAKGGSRNIRATDTIFFGIAHGALFLWLILGQPIASSIVLISVGLIGFVPTISKAWHEPHSETLTLYLLNTARHLMSIAAISQYAFVTMIFPIVWGTFNALFVSLLIMRRIVISKSTAR